MLEIRRIVVSPEVEAKLWEHHRLTRWQMEQVVFDSETEYVWDVDPVHGGRLIARGFDAANRLIFVALNPVDEDGTWRCVTAFSPTDPGYGSAPNDS